MAGFTAARVLIIDGDVGTLLSYKTILRAAGHEVTTVALGEDGIAAARREMFDVVFSDLLLPDVSGLDVIRSIRQASPSTGIVMVSGWATTDCFTAAHQVGATVCARKPLSGDDLLSALAEARRAHAREAIDPTELAVGYAARRWAAAIAGGTRLTHDPRTVANWCRQTGVATGTLKGWCRSIGVTSKASLDIMRLLRIVLAHPEEAWNLAEWLDIVDERTMKRLRERAGFGNRTFNGSGLIRFLDTQLVVNRRLVAALREQFVPGGHVRK